MDSSEKHILAGKRIIISGAGIAGLMFARALELNWPASHPKPEVIIYERSTETQPKSRDGYSIGIRVESGLKALHSAGLLPDALAVSTTKADRPLQIAPSFWDTRWNLLAQGKIAKAVPEHMPKDTPSYIRLCRGTLRKLLLKDLTTTIHYENMIQKAHISPNGTIELDLSNGTTTTCDLLVAADGANSKLRQSLLPDQKLTFAGVVCYLGQSEFPQGKPEPLKERWGINISGQGVPFLVFPVDDTHGVWATSYRTTKPVKALRAEEAERKREQVLDIAKRTSHMFDDPCKQFIDATETEGLTVFNAMHKYPVDHAKDLPQANVVFLGDANHPMSPFSGNGANMALMDGLVFAQELIKSKTSVRTAIDAFDAESMPRSKKAIDMSWWTIRILHSQGWTYWLVRALIAFIGFVTWLKRA